MCDERTSPIECRITAGVRDEELIHAAECEVVIDDRVASVRSRRGDRVRSIARRFDRPFDELLRRNSIMRTSIAKASCCVVLTVVVGVACLYAIQTHAQQRVVSARPSNTPAIPGEEKYYVVLLAHQDAENTIPMSHTFAVFMRTRGEGANRKVMETATINWLPKSGHISIARPAEPGVNKPLGETLEWAKQRNLEVSMCGPFEIDAGFYQRAVAHVARLERGEFQYRCYAKLRNTTKNCIYAVADIFDDEPRLDTGSSRGTESMLKVLEYYKPRFKSKELAASEFAPLLADLKLNGLRQAGMETAMAGE
jgi:hypothetical protein